MGEGDLKREEISSTVFLKGCGVAPRKMRTVARVLKNRSVEDSLCLLSYIEKKCVVLFEKLLKSAFSSLERKCVDVDGNVNFYNVDKGIKNLFNVNKVNEIDKSIREKGLFSLNYPYIIKYYHPFLARSTDDGCYIFQLLNLIN